MIFQDMPYQRIDLEEVKQEMKELMEAFQAAKSGEEQFRVHQNYYRIRNHVETQSTLAHIRNSVDTSDPFYEEEQAYYDQVNPEISNLFQEYEKLLYDSPYRETLEQKIGPVAFKNMELDRKSYREDLIPLQQEENALVTRYNKVIASAKIDWEGEELNLSLLKPYQTSRDRDVRLIAWQKHAAYFESVTGELDEIFDQLVKNRTAQARKLGYENYVELGYYRMTRNSYGIKEVEKFREQIKRDYVPFSQRVEERRRKRLGVEKLSRVDKGVYFQEGNPAPAMSPEEILRMGQKMYRELSPETGAFMDFMMENELFDVLGRKSKRAGGYMTYLPDYHSPFVFANFNGTSGDLSVITHECGHAFQGYLAGQDPIREHADITMETAETHSMSMEFFTDRYMELFLGADADRYRTMHLEDAILFVPYGCMVDEFQHIVYAHPELTPVQRKAEWRKLEKIYEPHLQDEGLDFYDQGGWWQAQLHIYNYPFYYIDYVLAQTCAFMYKVKMEEDYQGAWQSYLRLCRMSASKFYEEALHEVGLEVPYTDGCIRRMTEKLEKLL